MYEKILLKNGVKILYEQVPYVRSAAMGIFAGCGSRLEAPSENGASHFIEHMVFKGTDTRTAADIASEMDAIGGQVNAYTTKETTCFYARALSEHLDRAADILCDMFLNPRFDPKDVETERGVIVEEIGMYDDTPEDLVVERLLGKVYGGSSLGRPILGTRATLQGLTAERLKTFKKRHYRADQTIVSLSGCFDEKLLDTLKETFSVLENPNISSPAAPIPHVVFTAKEKDIAQNHLCLSWPGRPAGDPDRFVTQIFNCILGGGASSRLFQSVRERLGLCYTVYTFTSAYRDTGLFSVYTAVNPETEGKALTAIREEFSRFLQDGPTPEEVDRAREQVKAGIVMGMESIQTRMSHMARSEQVLGRIPSLDELVAQYDAVTREQVWDMARCLLRPEEMSLSAVGKVRRTETYHRYFQ